MTEELLMRYPDVDGIVAANDMVAISIYKVLHKKGIRVPKQIQLIGYDNIYLSELMTPALTTVAQPIDEMGVKAVDLLIHRDETADNAQSEFVFFPKLVARETTIERRVYGRNLRFV